MPITLVGGVLVRRIEDDENQFIDATVRYEFSNGNKDTKVHARIPMAGVHAIAVAAGRTEHTRSDVITYIMTALGEDMAPATIIVAEIAP